GALNYVFDVGKEATHTKNAERVGGNMAGNDPRELSRGSFPAMLPPTRSAFFVCVASLPTSKT
ncbi:hypothetical protein, partial [Aeromonas caviae]|uniref:hypothetical protein n=1 Tax=Aeromonas caviae TaxID=648 RepID=UPI001CC5BDE6